MNAPLQMSYLLIYFSCDINIIIQTFVTRTVSANILNLRRRQSLGEEDGGSEVYKKASIR